MRETREPPTRPVGHVEYGLVARSLDIVDDEHAPWRSFPNRVPKALNALATIDNDNCKRIVIVGVDRLNIFGIPDPVFGIQ